MDILVLVFLSSGLFLGWSLGANDASNVFGTAVASRMISFTTAAVICSIFVILGAVFRGAGAAHGLGALGSVNTLAGAFMSAFSAAITVLWMTRAGLPVSTTQAVVGAIIGWNLYSGSLTDLAVLSKIFATWVACPLLGAMIAAILYRVTVRVVYWSKIHLLRLDYYTRAGLVFAGAFGSYSLGANNIGNVMGVFVTSSPFTDVAIGNWFTFTSVQQLFLVGAIAIGVEVEVDCLLVEFQNELFEGFATDRRATEIAGIIAVGLEHGRSAEFVDAVEVNLDGVKTQAVARVLSA